MAAARWLVLLAAALLGVACAPALRTRCDPKNATCRADEVCVSGGAGSFCVVTCNGGGSCPFGQRCHRNMASSCPYCLDRLDICY